MPCLFGAVMTIAGVFLILVGIALLFPPTTPLGVLLIVVGLLMIHIDDV